jgi:hypothetical protein
MTTAHKVHELEPLPATGMLHLMTEMLAAATGGEPHVPADLAATTRDLLAHLERHLSSEEAVLVAGNTSDHAPGTATRTCRPHEWCALSGDGVLEVDGLPAGQLVDAAVDRLVRLRSGEQIGLRSSRSPHEVWRRMDRACPGDYGFDYLQDGPDRWRVQVTRRRAT